MNEIITIEEAAKYQDTPFTRDEITEIFQKIEAIRKFIMGQSTKQLTINKGKRAISSNIIYEDWTVGIATNEEKRKSEHGNPQIWKCWECTSDKVSREVERYYNDFLNSEGDGGGGGDDSKLIYCFETDSISK